MLSQYAATVLSICVILTIIGIMFSSPNPYELNWGDKLAIISIIIGFVAFWMTAFALIWGI
jgi:hypothetical protein